MAMLELPQFSRLRVALVLAFVVTAQGGCKPRPASDAANGTPAAHGEPTPVQRSETSNPPQPAALSTYEGSKTAVATATQWLTALRAQDHLALSKLTFAPFEFRDTGTEGDCKSATAASASEIKTILGCLSRNELLIEELRATEDFGAKVVVDKDIPRWAAHWVKELSPPSVPVWTFIHGNGVSYELVVLVEAQAVQGLLKDAQFEAN
jgi:hypothetical protein